MEGRNGRASNSHIGKRVDIGCLPWGYRVLMYFASWGFAGDGASENEPQANVFSLDYLFVSAQGEMRDVGTYIAAAFSGEVMTKARLKKKKNNNWRTLWCRSTRPSLGERGRGSKRFTGFARGGRGQLPSPIVSPP